MMKAVYISEFSAEGKLEIREVPRPSPGPEDILIRVHCAALNRADLLQKMGMYPPPAGIPEEIPGLECTGEVCEIGAKVNKFRPGDGAMALLAGGGQAEYVVVHQDIAMPTLHGLSWEQYAAIPEVFLTAYDALVYQAHFSLGESVLIHAVGSGVGTAALQLARLAGARKIFGTASAEKLQKARELKLDVGIDYHCQDFAEVVLNEEPAGVEVILDLVGGNYWNKNIQCLCIGGKMVLIGALGSRKFPEDAALPALLRKRAKITGTVLRSRPHHEKAALVQSFCGKILPLFERHLKPVVDKVFAMADVEKAYEYMRNSHNFGKVVLRW